MSQKGDVDFQSSKGLEDCNLIELMRHKAGIMRKMMIRMSCL
jgi:hypothetical protein